MPQDQLIKPEIFDGLDKVIALMTTKNISSIEQISIPSDKLAIPGQIHSSNVCVVDKPGVYEECDSLVTNKRGIYLLVSVADCAPVYIYDLRRNCIALVHCGWRGARDKIIEKTIDVLRREFKSEARDLIAYIGPCASVCCNVKFLRFKKEGKYHFDLKGEIYSQLVNSGLDFRNIGVSKYCTICGSDLFHSYRRDGEKSGRMWALLGLEFF